MEIKTGRVERDNPPSCVYTEIVKLQRWCLVGILLMMCATAFGQQRSGGSSWYSKWWGARDAPRVCMEFQAESVEEARGFIQTHRRDLRTEARETGQPVPGGAAPGRVCARYGQAGSCGYASFRPAAGGVVDPRTGVMISQNQVLDRVYGFVFTYLRAPDEVAFQRANCRGTWAEN